MQPDPQNTSAPPHSYNGVVLFLVAFIGCCIFISGLLMLVHTSRRRRHAVWFRLCRRWPALSRWLEPINPSPESSQVFKDDKINQLFPKQRYQGETPESCRVCLDDIRPNEMVRTLPCQHIFHTKCIEIWLTKYRTRCPICNLTIDEDGRVVERERTEQDTTAIQPRQDLSRPPTAASASAMPYGTGIVRL